MTLRELKLILSNAGSRHFRLELPDGPPVPVSFHVTEVGLVRKTFIDCGGTLRESAACQLQVWVGEDVDHRLEARKAAQILEKAKAFLTDESLPVEIEYEDKVISQYTVEGRHVDSESVVLRLAHKHTQCLAPELCGLPAKPKSGASPYPATSVSTSSPCCGTAGCC